MAQTFKSEYGLLSQNRLLGQSGTVDLSSVDFGVLKKECRIKSFITIINH